MNGNGNGNECGVRDERERERERASKMHAHACVQILFGRYFRKTTFAACDYTRNMK